ncbi:G-protein coupled receptor family C group 5 member C-like [Scleropages formosus]|uniref:G-protein coupled receptor family C group 5 member C-like n=1 Tax=Scleropages formosus TaxID=113540 RepID=A0A0N8JZW0_SCLFO|nr:G-protein coupled receptor family C group 5 member C-like [Scleropages formosus]
MCSALASSGRFFKEVDEAPSPFTENVLGFSRIPTAVLGTEDDIMKLLHVLLLSLVAPLSCLPGARGSNSTPNGCGSSVDSLYFNLCDLSAVWGVVVEAFAAAGVVTSLLMLIVLLASLPFATDGGRRSSVGLQAGFLVSTLGLFALTFAFIVGRDFATCASRRFLFGDFAMALIYVIVLLLGALAASVPGLTGSRREWRKGAAFVLVACLFSVGIWVAWIVMYVYGNRERGSPAWDDPTLAIALVSNAWVFLILHAIPEVCSLTEESKAQPVYGEDLYPTRGVGYETILKEQGSQSMFMENKAFSMDEPNADLTSRSISCRASFIEQAASRPARLRGKRPRAVSRPPTRGRMYAKEGTPGVRLKGTVS